MSVWAVLGAQWGDEGKGKVVDFLAGRAKLVIRYQGGDNAGHTVINEFGNFGMHLIPSGIFNPKAYSLIGTGTVVNPVSLLKEMEQVRDAKVPMDKLIISNRAHLVMPYHVALDKAEEKYRAAISGKEKIGTTLRGIGPAYADKIARWGIQCGEILDWNQFTRRVKINLERANRILNHVYDEPELDYDEMMAAFEPACRAIAPFIADSYPLIRKALDENWDMILEGQLGVMRDVDWGTYPFVTSSNPIAGGACAGAGIPPQRIDQVIGVVKAYSTSVGEGPMPTELTDETGKMLRDLGGEYGVTTGRARRCGWIDLVALKFAAQLSGFSSIAITKLDVLDSFKEIKLCVAYDVTNPDGTKYRSDSVPASYLLAKAEPVYITMPGWQSSTTDAKKMEDLPREAREYLRKIEETIGTKIKLVSVGARREQTIFI
ncbi:MAG: Adenylosuccinate synthetase [Firmicutes bacterium ADurb.Bin153]|nr:MAG: Adenylosuccinate synthetase [Firmicutes bacterium ADurb.Bin153]